MNSPQYIACGFYTSTAPGTPDPVVSGTGKKRIAFIECISDSTMRIAFMFVNEKYRIAFKGIQLRNLEEKLILEFQ